MYYFKSIYYKQYNQKKYENEQVKVELDLADDNDVVYKLVGPVLMKEDLSEARSTVEKRIEFINKEMYYLF